MSAVRPEADASTRCLFWHRGSSLVIKLHYLVSQLTVVTQVLVLTEKPAQKGHEWRTLEDVVSARAVKLTARMRLPRTIWETPNANMIRVRVRFSRSRDRLRDSDAGLRDPGPPMPPPRGSALTGMVTAGSESTKAGDRRRTKASKRGCAERGVAAASSGIRVRGGRAPSIIPRAPIKDALRLMGGERWADWRALPGRGGGDIPETDYTAGPDYVVNQPFPKSQERKAPNESSCCDPAAHHCPAVSPSKKNSHRTPTSTNPNEPELLKGPTSLQPQSARRSCAHCGLEMCHCARLWRRAALTAARRERRRDKRASAPTAAGGEARGGKKKNNPRMKLIHARTCPLCSCHLLDSWTQSETGSCSHLSPDWWIK